MKALRECKNCGLKANNEYELDMFASQKTAKYGKQNYCKKCRQKQRHSTDEYERHKVRKRAMYKESQEVRDSVFFSGIKYRYGLSKDDYFLMISKQDNSCSICGKNFDAIKSKPHIDHCHDTGRVRGLLCKPCNTALGTLGDSIESINNVMKYLLGGN